MSKKASGWGATDANKGPNSEVLQMLTVITGPCIPAAPETTTEIPVTTTTDSTTPRRLPSIICAAAFTTGGICTSDIGGPLLTSSGLIGIASWHPTPCASQPVTYKLNSHDFIK